MLVVVVVRVGRLCMFSRGGEVRVMNVEKDGLLASNECVSGWFGRPF